MLELKAFKTEAGRAEIRARTLPLSRAARNLLLVIDASKPTGEWLRLVAGVDTTDLQTLLDHGLIAAQSGAQGPATSAIASTATLAATPAMAPAATPTAASDLLPDRWAEVAKSAAASAAPAMPGATPAETPAAATAPAGFVNPPKLDRAQLYTYLSGEATKLLGPFKGYAFALDVERCDSLSELQALALQFAERVRKAKGDAAAAGVRDAVGLI